MDLRKIKKLIDLLDESNLAEIEIKEGEESVRLSRMPKNIPAQQITYSPAPTQAQPPPSQPPRAAPAGPAPASGPADPPPRRGDTALP